jgi:elongation factor Ts
MADVTAAMIKELRELSGAGMAACKNALVESEAQMERAIEILREKGLAAAAKKAGRIAAEGLVSIVLTDDRKKGAVAEVNIETDFAAKGQGFIDYVNQVTAQVLNSNAGTVEALLAEPWAAGNGTVQDELTQKIATIGENINIRRFERYTVDGDGVIVEYIHGGGKVGVMLEFESSAAGDSLVEAGRNLCMQIAAMSPRFVSRADVSADFIAREREILTQQAINEGKDAKIAEKMVEGRLNKELKDFCLLDQEYVKESDMTVKQYLDGVSKTLGTPVSVKRFVRFEKGEGIEKKVEDFAEEVSKAMNV